MSIGKVGMFKYSFHLCRKMEEGIVQCLFVDRRYYCVTRTALEIQSNGTWVGVFMYLMAQVECYQKKFDFVLWSVKVVEQLNIGLMYRTSNSSVISKNISLQYMHSIICTVRVGTRKKGVLQCAWHCVRVRGRLCVLLYVCGNLFDLLHIVFGLL